MVQVTIQRWPPCPYIVKTLKNLLLRNQKADDLENWYAASGACSNDDPGFTMTYIMAKSSLVHNAFIWEKGKTMDFSGTIVVCDVKVGRFSQLNEDMNLYEYQRSRSFIDLHPR